MRFASALGEVARWPFERIAWLLERRLVWPLGERVAGRTPSLRAAAAAAFVAVAMAAVAVGVLWPSGAGDGGGERVAVVPSKATVAAPTAETARGSSPGPKLQGVAPSFGVDGAAAVSQPVPAEAEDEAAQDETATPDSTTESETAAGATASSAKPVPAGPAAMKVAHRFSEAFVFYEIGKRTARAKAVFAETATPELAKALEERPPRQPEGAPVPKARVLNIVPGPRRGKAYTASVSLLRVGVTSELRITLQREKDGEWSVADVLG